MDLSPEKIRERIYFKDLSNYYVNTRDTLEKFIARDLISMLHIAGFLLKDAGILAEKSDLTNYINRHFRTSNNYFEISSQQKFIVIYKSGKKCYELFTKLRY